MIHVSRSWSAPVSTAPLVAAALVGIALFAVGCAEDQKRDIDLGALLKDAPAGSYVAGTATGLGEAEVLNQNDFIYAVAFSEQGDALAWVHHVTTSMEMTVKALDLAPPRAAAEPRFQVPINHHEFDIEDIVFTSSQDGQTPSLVLPSRQGIVRQFGSVGGELQQEFIYGEPLVRAAINPSRTIVALGSNLGRILLLDAETLAFRGEAMLHTDEVYGLAFEDDRTLLSGAFDRKVHRVAIDAGGQTEFSIASSPLKSGDQVFIAHLGGASAIATVRDSRQPFNVINSDAVKRLNLRPAAIGAVKVMTTVGEREVPAVELGDLRIRHLSVGRMIAAICDFCLPVGAELSLGKDALMRVQLADDVANEQILVRVGRTPSALPPAAAPAAAVAPAAAPPAAAAPASAAPTEATPPAEATASAAPVVDDGLPPLAQVTPGSVTMTVKNTVELTGPVTDIAIDARRKTALVTYSHARAMRTYDIYDAEKSGELPPPSAASGGVVVDLATFALGKRFIGHEGFTVTGAISPDGRTIATGGWDKRVLVFDVASGDLIADREEGWLIRRVTFSPDGQTLAVATWTPAQGTVGTLSDPSLILYPVNYAKAEAETGTGAPR